MSTHRPVTISLDVQAPGTLRVMVEPRGISVVASLNDTSAQSPVDRFGAITLTHEARAGERITLGVESRDSPDVAGEACISVARLPAMQKRQLRAERAFAEAGLSVRAGEPQPAFESYLTAARYFDDFDRLRAGQARHAMAELAYGKLSREDDAWWLARVALADIGPDASAGLRSALLSLEARTLLESDRFDPQQRRARVFDLLDEAQRFAEQDRFGSREPPRLDILRGFMEYRAGKVGEATTLFAKAATRCEQLQDWECYARALQNSASLAEEARDFTVALKAYSDALRMLPPNLDPQLTANIWGNQGRLQGTAGLFEQSEASHRVSIQLHAHIADCEGVRVGFARLGSLLVQVGSIAEGTSALTHATSLECPALLAAATRDIEASVEPTGEVCTDLPEAESLGPSGKLAVFNALMGLREALRLDNQPVAARRCVAAARDFAVTARTKVRLANAEAEAFLGDDAPTLATAAFRRAIEQADAGGLPQNNENRSVTYLGLARASLQANQISVARDHASKALVHGSARADVGQVVESLQIMARSYSLAKDDAQAISVLQTAAGLVDQVPIDDLDPEKRATWLATQHAVFAELTTLYANSANGGDENTWRAFETSERGRARSIRYAVNQATGRESASDERSVRYRDLMRRIADLARPVQEGKAPSLSMPELEALARADSATAADETKGSLQQALAAIGATAVEYAIGTEDMYAFVVDSQQIHVTRLGSRQDIASAAAALYDRLRNPESAAEDVRRAAAKLAQLVLWPVAEQVKGQRVVFVPDDSLHTVPFAILPWTKDESSQLLVERAELAVVPSTLFITHARAGLATRPSTSRFELIGDPVFQPAQWRKECAPDSATGTGSAGASPQEATARPAMRALPRLPGSRQEVLSIARLAQRAAPASRVSTHLGCDATPAALRASAASSPELLHIATHGHVDAFRPRLSALALTQDSAENGGTASVGLLDILNMRVDSRLVVLSACDTSRGRLLPGEGVLGPAQAFLQAGAASVIASYWRIPDERTAPFMEIFYRYLLVDRLNAASALRQTQLHFARDRAAHDWAAFTLYGWPDTAL